MLRFRALKPLAPIRRCMQCSAYAEGEPRFTAMGARDRASQAQNSGTLSQAVGELAFFVGFAGERSGLFAPWLTGALSKTLLWIDNIRTEANASGIEFALAPQIIVRGAAAQLGIYGAHNFSPHVDAHLWSGQVGTILLAGVQAFLTDAFVEEVPNLLMERCYIMNGSVTKQGASFPA